MTLITGCGGGGQTSNDAGGSDGSNDVASKFDAQFAVDSGDAGSDVEVDTGPPCAPGDFHLEVTNTSGTTMLTSGCGDAGAPSITWTEPCLDCWMLEVSACGNGESMQITADTATMVGTFSPAEAIRTDADGGKCQWDSTLTVYNWPNAGGTVKGEYAAYHTGACGTDPALVTGHFCLQRQ